MRTVFGNWRRAGDQRRSAGRVRHPVDEHPLFSHALETLPHARWAVACNAEFRESASDGLRGILHHDGAILRFTTWGGNERFAGAPMEFRWTEIEPGTFRVLHRGLAVSFTRLEPLANLVADPPPCAAAEDERLGESLASWMTTWAPSPPSPLTSPM